ncbi:hypothetical protein [Pseudomonas aeruginosa]|uniref:hypothetical protein n=1 Tax=Pseudomonas aeruginosa TaxID=287 RepID=UPI00128F64CE|nr:hypothetical protein [Pseudomonas aeruginosa]
MSWFQAIYWLSTVLQVDTEVVLLKNQQKFLRPHINNRAQRKSPGTPPSAHPTSPKKATA